MKIPDELEVDCRIYFYKRQFHSAICISILKLLVRVIKQAEEFDLISKDEFEKAFHELSAVRSSDITDVHSALRVL